MVFAAVLRLVTPLFTESFHCNLPPDEILRRVKQGLITASDASWRDSYVPSPQKPFRGSINLQGFVLDWFDRQGTGGRAQPPLLLGRVRETASGGSLIELTYRYAKVTSYASLLPWLLFPAYAVLGAWRRQQNHIYTVVGSLLALLVPVFSQVLAIVQLRQAAYIATPLLRQLLQYPVRPVQ